MSNSNLASITVNGREEYKKAFGKYPSGKRHYRFRIGELTQEGHTYMTFFDMMYSDAVKEAKKKACECGFTSITVLPER